MKPDIVMPKDNEEALLGLGEKLGFKELIFLYDDVRLKPKRINSNKIKTYTGGLIKNIKQIDEAKKNFDIILGSAQRSFFENKRLKYLINAEASPGKDLLYQRRAGLDKVMCRLAKEKGKVIVFNLQLLTKDNMFGRMIQNAKLCRKYKVKTLVATLATKPLEMRAPKDLQGFARTIKLL